MAQHLLILSTIAKKITSQK